MEIYAKFSLNREEGKTESTENVEAELLRALEDIGVVDVEDSVYDIAEVDIVPNPKSRGPKQPDVGPALLRLADAYFEARPVVLDFGDVEGHAKAEARQRNIEAMGPEEKALDDAIFHLLNQASEAIAKAKMARAKEAGRG